MVFCSIYVVRIMQPEVKPCKVEIGKGKIESSVQRQYAEVKLGRNNDLEGEICLQTQMGKKSCIWAMLGELLSTKSESWKNVKSR